MEPLLLRKSEAEVVRLLFEGFDIPAIAKQRNVTRNTVITQLQAVYKKAGVSNALELVAFAYKRGGFLY
jgi:DNA-binding NarL/FixJ family response regulator